MGNKGLLVIWFHHTPQALQNWWRNFLKRSTKCFQHFLNAFHISSFFRFYFTRFSLQNHEQMYMLIECRTGTWFSHLPAGWGPLHQVARRVQPQRGVRGLKCPAVPGPRASGRPGDAQVPDLTFREAAPWRYRSRRGLRCRTP